MARSSSTLLLNSSAPYLHIFSTDNQVTVVDTRCWGHGRAGGGIIGGGGGGAT